MAAFKGVGSSQSEIVRRTTPSLVGVHLVAKANVNGNTTSLYTTRYFDNDGLAMKKEDSDVGYHQWLKKELEHLNRKRNDVTWPVEKRTLHLGSIHMDEVYALADILENAKLNFHLRILDITSHRMAMAGREETCSMFSSKTFTSLKQLKKRIEGHPFEVAFEEFTFVPGERNYFDHEFLISWSGRRGGILSVNQVRSLSRGFNYTKNDRRNIFQRVIDKAIEIRNPFTFRREKVILRVLYYLFGIFCTWATFRFYGIQESAAVALLFLFFRLFVRAITLGPLSWVTPASWLSSLLYCLQVFYRTDVSGFLFTRENDNEYQSKLRRARTISQVAIFLFTTLFGAFVGEAFDIF